MFIKIFLIYQLRRVVNIRTIKHLRLSISFCFFSYFFLLFPFFVFPCPLLFPCLPPSLYLPNWSLPYYVVSFFVSLSIRFQTCPFFSFSLSSLLDILSVRSFLLSLVSFLISSIYLSCAPRAFSSLPLSFFFFVLLLLQEIVKPETLKIKVEFRLSRITIEKFTCPKVGPIIVRNSREVTQYLPSKYYNRNQSQAITIYVDKLCPNWIACVQAYIIQRRQQRFSVHQNIVNDDRDFWTCTKVFQLTQRKGNNMDAYVKTTSEHRYQTEPVHFVTVAIVCHRNDSLLASENFPTIRSFVNLTEMCTMFTNSYFSTRLHSQRLLFQRIFRFNEILSPLSYISDIIFLSDIFRIET